MYSHPLRGSAWHGRCLAAGGYPANDMLTSNHLLSRSIFVLAFAVAATLSGSLIASAQTGSAGSATPSQRWVGTWAVSPQTQEGFASIPAVPPPVFSNQTLRQIVHTSIGGSRVRVRFANTFGTVPLVIGAASVGLRATGAQIVPGTYRALTFGGHASVTVSPGASALSDAASLDVPALGDLAVSLFLRDATVGTTQHFLSSQTNYVAVGNQTAQLDPGLGTTMKTYFFLQNVDVLPATSAGAIVCLGDSITDGNASTLDANHRWPNFLARRLQGRRGTAYNLGVLDQGICGNRLCHDAIGPALLSRFDPDAVAQAGVSRVILLAGINDIAFGGYLPDEAVSADDIIAAYRQIIARAHEAGLTIFGGTLTPYAGTAAPYYTDDGETKREAVNDFIRFSGEFDGVIDFEAAVRDASTPPRLRPECDSGDHLHPNDTGYAAMAAAVKLKLFKNL